MEPSVEASTIEDTVENSMGVDETFEMSLVVEGIVTKLRDGEGTLKADEPFEKSFGVDEDIGGGKSFSAGRFVAEEFCRDEGARTSSFASNIVLGPGFDGEKEGIAGSGRGFG